VAGWCVEEASHPTRNEVPRGHSAATSSRVPHNQFDALVEKSNSKFHFQV
jgi:hypothetical protein